MCPSTEGVTWYHAFIFLTKSLRLEMILYRCDFLNLSLVTVYSPPHIQLWNRWCSLLIILPVPSSLLFSLSSLCAFGLAYFPEATERKNTLTQLYILLRLITRMGSLKGTLLASLQLILTRSSVSFPSLHSAFLSKPSLSLSVAFDAAGHFISHT